MPEPSDDPPTLLVDEADTIFGGKNADANEDLRGLLNAGHQRNRPAIRWDAGTRSLEKIPTFAMAALAGIGAMPDTIEDRAAVIRMRRRAPGETVAPYRHRRDGPALRRLARDLRDWLRAHLDTLEAAVPVMPVEDRAADPEAPWADYGPTGLTAMKLGVLLREYDIRSVTMRFPDCGQAKGYQRGDFADAWARYCPPETEPPGQPSQPYQASPPSSARYGFPPWYGSSRTSDPSRTNATSGNEAGTAGTAHPAHAPVCIRCRAPLAYDDGTHTHPTCDTA